MSDNPFIQKAERQNPFVIRQTRRLRAQATMKGHFVALKTLHEQVKDDAAYPSEAKARIAARMEEARQGIIAIS